MDAVEDSIREPRRLAFHAGAVNASRRKGTRYDHTRAAGRGAGRGLRDPRRFSILLDDEAAVWLEQIRNRRQQVRLERLRVGRVREHEVEAIAAPRQAPHRRAGVAGEDAQLRGRRAEAAARSRRRAAASGSTSTAERAPRDTASIPTAPVPAKRSRTSAPPTLSPRRSKSAARARDEVGRALPVAPRRRPFHRPARTRTSGGFTARAREAKTGSGAR